MGDVETIMRDKQVRDAVGVVCLLFGLSGCLNLGIGLAPTVGNLQQSVVSEGEALPEFARAAGGVGVVYVSGQIVGRLRCDYLVSDLKEVSGGLEISVTVVSGRQGCNSRQPSTLSYLGNIFNLDPGPMTVVVKHRYQGVTGIAGERFNSVVNVN